MYAGEDNPFYGKHHSKESKKEMGAKMGTDPWNKGDNDVYSNESLHKMSDAKKGMYYGKDNPNWLGGLSFEPYDSEFNNQLKQQIMQRDAYVCQLCNKFILGRYGTHHIDYNKKNSTSFNLVLLCHQCHMMTNSNREYWMGYLINHQLERGLSPD